MSEPLISKNLLSHLEVLEKRDFFEIPNFLDLTEVEDLRVQIQALKQNQKFCSAKIGAAKRLEKEIRSDEICWIDDAITSDSLALKNYFLKLDQIEKILNEKYFLGLGDLESHFSLYQAGAFYQRHLDASSPSSARKLSVVCYLNSFWRAEDGGELRIYFDNQYMDIAPTAGKLVGFLSHLLEHEVLKSYNERLSLTSWFL